MSAFHLGFSLPISIRLCMLLNFFCLLLTDVKGQTNTIDSTRNQYHLALKQGNLNLAMNTAYSLVNKFHNIKIDSSIVWVKKTLVHAEATNNQKMMISSLLQYSELSFIKNKTLYALNIAERADSLLQFYPNDTLYMECLYRRAEGKEYNDEPELAMQLYLECSNQAEKINNTRMLIKLSEKLGNISNVNDDHQQAVAYFKKGLKYAMTSDKYAIRKWVLLGAICQVQVENADKFLEKEIISAYDEMNEFFQPDNKIIHPGLKSYLYNIKVDYIINYGAPDEINQLVLTPIEIIKEKSINEGFLLGELNRNFEIALRQQKLSKAKLYLGALKECVQKADSEGVEKEVLLKEIAYLEATKDYKRLVEAFKRLHTLQLQLENNERMSSLANLEGKLEAKEKEHEIKLLTTQSRQNKIIAFGVSLLALLVFLLFRNARVKNQKIAIQNVEISDKNKQLELLNQTKDRLFAIIGHDLRKPAASFRGISKKVKYLIKKQDFETLDKYGQQIEQNALSLNKLTNNLLNWALMQRNVMPYNPQVISISDIAADIKTIFDAPARDKNIAIINQIPNNITVYADTMALTTILTNLVDNAIKYTPEGGQISISALEENEKQLKIRVADTGIGMEKDQIHDLFLLKKDKSQEGTSGEKGTGLGLRLVKELVELNKGIISAVSELGKGTTIEVMLPRI